MANTARIIAIVQARMGSTRLPGKTLADISGKPLLSHVVERTRASKLVNGIIIATTQAPEDDAIIQWAKSESVPVYRGSTEDVLDRFYQAALEAKANIIVRVTADDPFKDPEVIDSIIEKVLSSKVDYASNTLEPTFPEGLDVEAFTFDALARAWKEARLPSEREHVTPYLWKHPELFKIGQVKNAADLSSLRWTLDYEPDLQFTREIYRRLYKGKVFGMKEILALLKAEPALAEINKGIPRNQGYADSLRKDKDRAG